MKLLQEVQLSYLSRTLNNTLPSVTNAQIPESLYTMFYTCNLYESNKEYNFIKECLTFKNHKVDIFLQSNAEMVEFIYDSMLILNQQNLMWMGELDVVEEGDPENDKLLFIYRPQNKISSIYLSFNKESINEKSLFKYFVRNLFKKSKPLRRKLILDERAL